MAKIKVLLNSIYYPMAIVRYWERALRRREDVELKTVGSYTGTWIPWEGGMNLPAKYAVVPDIALPQHFSEPTVDYNFVKAQLGDWIPDLNLTVDSTRNWVAKPSDGFVATIATDAHCIDYSHQRTQVDKFFNMHQRYAQPTDYILPYAFDPSCHYKEEVEKKETEKYIEEKSKEER